MNMNYKTIGLLVLISVARLQAAEHSDPSHGAAEHTESATHTLAGPAYSHPAVPERADWAGATVIGILGSFLLAAAVGVGVRLNTPEEMPATHSHDEPPGKSHHHGPGVTVHPGPEHDLPGGHAHHH
jgi:hypothetical protein